MNDNPITVTIEELAERLGVTADVVTDAVKTAARSKEKVQMAGVTFWNLITDEDEEAGLCWGHVGVFAPNGERFWIKGSGATYDCSGRKVADGVIF